MRVVYIHLNPSEYTDDLTHAYSSYPDYLRLRSTDWVRPDFILKFFETLNTTDFIRISSYKKFVENFKVDSIDVLGRLTLEDPED